MRKLYNLLILLIILLNFSCSSDEGLEIKAIRDFDIYANDTLNNVFVFDMATTSRGVLIASVSSNSILTNKLSGDGRLHFLEVDFNGNVIWEDISSNSLFLSGYPSNLIKTNSSDVFFVLWNEFAGNLKKITINTGSSPDSLGIEIFNCNGCKAEEALLYEDKIYTLGLSEGISGSNTVINEFSLDGQSNRLLTVKTFDASRFGGFGLTDLNFVNRINNFLHLTLNGGRLLFSGPSNSEMIFTHAGEIIPEYANNNLWIAQLSPDLIGNENFALIIQNPLISQSQSIFINGVDLSGLPGESDLQAKINESKFRFSSLDPDLPQFIVNYDPLRWVIVGTSISGLPSIISINTETSKITRSVIGDNARLNVAKAMLTQNEELLIAGTTIVNGRFQRPFLIRVSRGDIF